MPDTPTTTPWSVRLSTEDLDQVRAVAASEHRSVSNMLVVLIGEALQARKASRK